ncbi:hypothetical protein B9Z19DRAFT_1070025 [Tuber borchii]|uniref:Uncharacterized protein n=1 Tax=Tuber borchii TaxID=42251 RepID=A0A2T7A9B0_TUBBO|nr:hypothetical protein B9Z19DRAFT_1070025 [Tuber borchii]
MFAVGESSFTRNSWIASVRTPRYLNTEECIHRFREWRSGRGGLNPPKNNEKGLILKVSVQNFKTFKKFLGIDDENESGKFPTYTYNRALSTLTIQCSPSSIHEKAVTTISKGFTFAFGTLPVNTQDKIDTVTNEKYDNFKGKYAGSEKIADLAVQVENDTGVREAKFIVEIGLSESYQKLVQDAELWLKGTETVKIVMLVKLHENPPYRCPTHNRSDEEFDALKFPSKEDINEQCFSISGEYGPATYKDLVWVGEISGYIEFWGLDEISKLACVKGDRIDLLSADKPNKTMDKYLSMSNFVPGMHHPIHFNSHWAAYLRSLKHYIGQLAASRCRTTLKDRYGRTNTTDYEFMPPSPVNSLSGSSSFSTPSPNSPSSANSP